MDTDGFIAYLKNYYQKKYTLTIEDLLPQCLDITEGLPANCPKPVSTRFEKVDDFLLQWKNSGKLDVQQAKAWSTHEWVTFLKKPTGPFNRIPNAGTG
jgi:hypothetical protein